ncbi:solute carrier family 35, member C2, isoform CRA_a [Rattus norvegicus]|uniref:Solute carrier family 35, member C2, isoform CRA_a n=1 Tax=Rattus norvegicus TaxID=10116 RepID=A6JXE6_RAT|nr:solute carrier family 35, member C2, isoform CRA_a [Rattus norvegicus]
MGRWALDVAFVWKAALTLGLVLLYYCFSIGITFYNKWLTKSFHFPLFMTMLHLAVIFLFSALSLPGAWPPAFCSSCSCL